MMQLSGAYQASTIVCALQWLCAAASTEASAFSVHSPPPEAAGKRHWNESALPAQMERHSSCRCMTHDQ